MTKTIKWTGLLATVGCLTLLLLLEGLGIAVLGLLAAFGVALVAIAAEEGS